MRRLTPGDAASFSTGNSGQGQDIDTIELDELTFLLESGSDRVGALDFQESAEHYAPRDSRNASLEELLTAAERVEKGIPLTAELGRALLQGTSIGGARPKTTITSDDRKYIAKFSSQNDLYSVVKAEYIAMRLAAEAGLRSRPFAWSAPPARMFCSSSASTGKRRTGPGLGR